MFVTVQYTYIGNNWLISKIPKFELRNPLVQRSLVTWQWDISKIK